MAFSHLKHAPSAVDISQLKVFISYKTQQWEFASWLGDELSSLGFDVLIVPPLPATAKLKTQTEIKRELQKLVKAADCLCLVASQASLDSEWVQFEYKEAVESIGRLTFVCDNTLMPAGNWMVEKNPGGLSSRIYVKSNTLHFPSQVTFHVHALAVELINDPEEGIWENPKPVNPEFSKREFKRDSLLRKFARECALHDSRFTQRFIFDVFPFSWNELMCTRGNLKAGLEELLMTQGRHKAAMRISDRIVKAEHVAYSVRNDHPLRRYGVKCAEAFVLVGLRGWQTTLQKKEDKKIDEFNKVISMLDDLIKDKRK